MKIKKTGEGKFGHYLLEDDGAKGKFHSCSAEVSSWVEKHIPCDVTVQEITGKTITRVVIAKSADAPQMSSSLSKTDSSAESISKDKLIVRQSCLKAAVEMSNVVWVELLAKGSTLTLDAMQNELLKVAEEFEKWVWRE